MAPYYSVDDPVVDAAFFKYFVDIFGDVEAGDTVFDGSLGEGSVVPPVFSAAEIEHYCFILLLVLYQEGEGRHIHRLMAFLDGLDEGPGWDDDVGGCVYYGDFDGGVAFREVE